MYLCHTRNHFQTDERPQSTLQTLQFIIHAKYATRLAFQETKLVGHEDSSFAVLPTLTNQSKS